MHICDFCGKDQNKVKQMIVTKDKGIAICEDCVFLCIEVMLKKRSGNTKKYRLIGKTNINIHKEEGL